MDEARQKTVLIVDNDQSVRDTMAKVVEKMGYAATAVESANRAASVLAKGGIDAMLLDLNMPGAQGEQLLRFIGRRQGKVPPTIVVSGYLHRERIRPLFELGVSGVIAKPFDVKRLMDELRRVLEGEGRARALFCPRCGAALAADGRFCRQCGGTVERRLVCRRCGAPVEPGARFCGGCGVGMAEA